MVTWVKFRDLKTAKEFYHFNTHLDHEVQKARERGAALIRSRVEQLNTSLPVVLTGDFNCTTSNKAHQILVAGDFFKDTWLTARERRGEGLSTFNSFKAIPRNNTRIDWILARGSVEVSATEIITFSRNNQFPSDHLPVVVWMRLPK
jgi:endonuclease/exonuclease/phosphatase family metal-dependent hydrolase